MGNWNGYPSNGYTSLQRHDTPTLGQLRHSIPKVGRKSQLRTPDHWVKGEKYVGAPGWDVLFLVMEICCLSRSGDSVSSALCCGLCLSVGPRWDSGWTVLQIGTSLCLIYSRHNGNPLATVFTYWESYHRFLPQIPTTDSYYHKVTDTCHAPIF
eukprot:jgi/Chrzof1/6272/UNPLg00852.t1